MVNEQPTYCTCGMFSFGGAWRSKLGRLYVLHLYVPRNYQPVICMGTGLGLQCKQQSSLGNTGMFFRKCCTSILEKSGLALSTNTCLLSQTKSPFIKSTSWTWGKKKKKKTLTVNVCFFTLCYTSVICEPKQAKSSAYSTQAVVTKTHFWKFISLPKRKRLPKKIAKQLAYW